MTDMSCDLINDYGDLGITMIDISCDLINDYGDLGIHPCTKEAELFFISVFNDCISLARCESHRPIITVENYLPILSPNWRLITKDEFICHRILTE